MAVKSLGLEREKRTSFYIFMSFWIVGFLVFQMIPIFWGVNASFTNQMAFSVKVKFVGLKNYVEIFQDAKVYYSIMATFVYALTTTVLQVGMGFILALLVNSKMKGRSFFRVMYYLPYIIPVVAAGWILRVFFDFNVGTLNVLLLQFHLIESNINWMGMFPLLTVLAAGVWRVGWSLLIFIGGLSTIPSELYDAADVDGAGYFRKLRVITIPLISPFIGFQFIVSFIYGMQEFILPYILNPTAIRGGQITAETPPPDTFFILAKGYDLIFNGGRLAYGFAMLWITFLIILAFSLIYAQIEKKTTFSEMDK